MSAPTEPATPRTGSKLVTGLVLVTLWLAMFIVPSAVLRQLGHSRWLALAAGALAFPVAPLGWHIVAEWRRKKREATTSTLTGGDRLALRTVFLAVLAIGGTFVLARGTAWTALRHHALWFTSWTDPDPIDDHELLRRIPADAEYVIWVRPGTSAALLPLGLSGDIEMVIAGKADQKITMMSGDPAVLDRLESISKTGGHGDKLKSIEGTTANVRILATPEWAGARGPSPLLSLLRRAPADAKTVAAAARYPLLTAYGISSAVAWARVGDAVYFGAEAEAASAEAAEKALTTARTAFETLTSMNDCGNKAFGNLTDRKLERDGVTIRGSGTLSLEAAKQVPLCMMGK